MKKIWLIAKMAYLQRVRSGAFLILTFGIPVLMVIAGAIPFLQNRSSGELPPVGYVDRTAGLAPVEQVQVEGVALDLRAFDDAETARAAVEAEEVAGFLVVPEDYFSGGLVQYVGPESPNEQLIGGLEKFLRLALLPGQPEWLADRLADPGRYTYVALDSGQQVQEGLPLIVRFATPAVLALMFGLAVTFTAGQMGQAVAQEKETRAMEMVITSLRPRELVAGKVLGLSLLTLTQFAIWGLAAMAALLLALSGSLGAQDLVIPWASLGWAVLLIVPGYFLFAVLAAGLGIIAGDTQQAQQLAGILGVLGLAPLWFLGILFQQPDSPVGVFLSLFPLTSPSFLLLRMAVSEVPAWQLVAAVVLLVLSLLVSLWLVARVFRAAMLLYGSSLNPRQVWQAVRAS